MFDKNFFDSFRYFTELPKGWIKTHSSIAPPPGTVWIKRDVSIFDDDFEQAILIFDPATYESYKSKSL